MSSASSAGSSGWERPASANQGRPVVADKIKSFLRNFDAALLLGASLFFAWQAQQARERSTWDSTYGRVIGTHTTQSEIPPRLQSGYRPPNVKPLVLTSVWTDYSYEVKGERFAGHWREGSRSSRRAFVLVYYDPDHPERSALELPNPAAPKVDLAFSILLLLLGVLAGGGKPFSKLRARWRQKSPL